MKYLLHIFSRITKAEIVKVFSFTALSTLVRMLTGLISVKVVALIIGPAGIALLGQLNSFATIVMTLAQGGINSGVTKYIAGNRENASSVKTLISTGFRFTLWCSLACGCLMLLLHEYLSRWIMLSPDYGYVFVIFGITVIFYSVNNLILSILNGYKDFRRFVWINIVNTLTGLIFTLVLVIFWKLKGALIAAVTFQSIMLFITVIMVRKLPWFSRAFWENRIDPATLRRYLSYSLMTFVTAATVPLSQLVLRGYVIADISGTEAGWWEAMNRLSGMYLMIITASFGVYYLPRLSEITAPKELRQEILKAYKVIMPILIVGFTGIYFFRVLIIRILFSPSFLPMQDLFFWQLLGDLFKIASWLLAFLMIAKSMTKRYIFSEISFSALFIALAFWFMRYHGVTGIVQAYCLNYFVYLCTMLVMFRKTLRQ